jgi:hypothetical protein
MYKCDHGGRITYQADPCPTAAKQDAIKPQGGNSLVRENKKAISTPDSKAGSLPQPLHYCKGQNGVTHAQRELCGSDQTEVSSSVAASPSGKSINAPLADEPSESDTKAVVLDNEPDQDFIIENFRFKRPSNLAMMGIAIGFIIMLIASIWLLIAAFKTGVWWGIGCLLLAPVNILFIVVHWNVAKKPFFLDLAGLAIFLGALLA